MHEYLERNYKKVRYILQISTELDLSALSKATACILYHKAQTEQEKLGDVCLDNYLVGPTCVYLASKLSEEALKIRDIVNVTYRVFHPKKDPLEIGKTYWKLRDSITTCELMLLRLFAFHVSYETPHKYLLHYLKSLQDWATDYNAWKESNFSAICWSVVNDVCYSPLIASLPAMKLATTVIYIGLEHTKLKVMEEEKTWYEVFCPGITREELKDGACQLLQLYKWKCERDRNESGLD